MARTDVRAILFSVTAFFPVILEGTPFYAYVA